jgi:hypothetical protein
MNSLKYLKNQNNLLMVFKIKVNNLFLNLLNNYLALEIIMK